MTATRLRATCFAVIALVSGPGQASATDFFEPRLLGAREIASMHRAIANAYATGTVIRNQDQVTQGFGGGTVVCKQGYAEPTENHQPLGPQRETTIVVENSANVCLNR